LTTGLAERQRALYYPWLKTAGGLRIAALRPRGGVSTRVPTLGPVSSRRRRMKKYSAR
jgi:hypothetical protein